MHLAGTLNDARTQDQDRIERRLAEINSEIEAIQQGDMVPQDRTLKTTALCREWMRLYGEVLRLDCARLPR